METVNTVNKDVKKKSSTKLRMLTSVVYIVVWVALCALKWCVPHSRIMGDHEVYWGSLGFDAAFCAVAVLGCIEYLRAIDAKAGENQKKLSTPQKAFTIAFCAMTVPLYVIAEIILSAGFLAVACAFAIYVMFLASTSVFDHHNSTVKGTISCVFGMLYCGVLTSFLAAINHLEINSMTAILVLFLSTILTDSGAYVIGSTFKRWLPAKLAPQLSPNKTVIGSIGGLLGGIIGSLAALGLMYLCGGMNDFVFLTRMNDVFLTFSSQRIHPVVSFLIIGLFTSLLAQIGDLFESALKRECGIKDMGNILPGHGGILDRFDSTLYCSIAVLFIFGTIIS